mgnify:CR=1 FL=1
MYQPILLYTYVYKSAEIGDIGNDAGNFHSRFQIIHGAYAIRKTEFFNG